MNKHLARHSCIIWLLYLFLGGWDSLLQAYQESPDAKANTLYVATTNRTNTSEISQWLSISGE